MSRSRGYTKNEKCRDKITRMGNQKKCHESQHWKAMFKLVTAHHAFFVFVEGKRIQLLQVWTFLPNVMTQSDIFSCARLLGANLFIHSSMYLSTAWSTLEFYVGASTSLRGGKNITTSVNSFRSIKEFFHDLATASQGGGLPMKTGESLLSA